MAITGAESWRGRLDEGCFHGQAECGTYLWMGPMLTVHRLSIECGLVQVPADRGGVTVLGRAGMAVQQACHAAMAWLDSPVATRLLGHGLLQPWRGLRESGRSLHAYFVLAPLDQQVDEVHLCPTAYLAILAAATGWKQDPRVRRWSGSRGPAAAATDPALSMRLLRRGGGGVGTCCRWRWWARWAWRASSCTSTSPAAPTAASSG